MKYTAQYFRGNMPEWKKREASLPERIIYRPISFHVSAFCANHEIHANTVSVFSTFVAVAACFMFLFANYWCNITGALLASLWCILDCTEGMWHGA